MEASRQAPTGGLNVNLPRAEKEKSQDISLFVIPVFTYYERIEKNSVIFLNYDNSSLF